MLLSIDEMLELCMVHITWGSILHYFPLHKILHLSRWGKVSEKLRSPCPFVIITELKILLSSYKYTCIEYKVKQRRTPCGDSEMPFWHHRTFGPLYCGTPQSSDENQCVNADKSQGKNLSSFSKTHGWCHPNATPGVGTTKYARVWIP